MKLQPIESPWSALQLIFWSRDHWMKRLAANQQKLIGCQRHLSETQHFTGRFRTNARSDQVELKRSLIEQLKSYRSVFLKFKCSQKQAS